MGSIIQNGIETEIVLPGGASLSAFNRTRMELKRLEATSSMLSLVTFNRTRMELKQAKEGRYIHGHALLIEPEWN